MKLFSFFILFSFLATGCSVYKSPQRKDFESESSTFRVQNLKQVSCSDTSIKTQAQASRLITVQQNEKTSESQFIWEYIIDNQSYFESDNLKGDFCAFELN